MKNMISVFLFSLLSVSLYGASNLSMVTYFPTPYMAYQDLNVEKNCSVGLINECNLKTGKLTVSNTLTLQQGQLNLWGGNITVSNFTFGNTTNNNVMGRVTFNEDLQIKATSSNGLNNIKTTSRATLNSLQLGSYDFPGCDATNNQISWKTLTLDGVTGDFLVCGDGTTTPSYAWKSSSVSSTRIPACVSNNSNNCSKLTVANCESGQTPDGNTISRPASAGDCPPGYPATQGAGFVYSRANSVSHENTQYYCNFTVYQCTAYQVSN